MVWIVDRLVGAGCITRFGQQSKALICEQIGNAESYMLGRIKGRMILIGEFDDGWYIVNYADTPDNSFGFGPIPPTK